MRFNKINYKLLAVFLLALSLRIYKISSIPPHLTPDEAALGYNAYSILHTLRDEHGQLLPIIFKSFGDYKPGLYVYLVVPTVALFGLTEFATRLPGVLAGALAPIILYFIVKQFSTKTHALIASLLLSVMPWHIHFSRGAWEANLSLTITLAGIIFFLKSFKRPIYALLSAILFSLTPLTYQGAKLSTPIIILSLVVVYRKELFKLPKQYLATSVALGILVGMPIILSLFTGEAGRLKVFSIFSYPRPEDYISHITDQAQISTNSLTYKLFYSEPLYFTKSILGRYFNHFSGEFLFFKGDWQNGRHSAPYQGMLQLADLALLPIGVLFAIKSTKQKFIKFVLLWLLLAPLPAAFSRDEVHAVRALNTAIPLALIISLGVYHVFSNFKKHKFTIFIPLFIYALSLLYFIDELFVHLPMKDSKLWFYGYRQVMQEFVGEEQAYAKIKIEQSYDQPYIYYLFYSKYDPKKYQETDHFNQINQYDVGYVDQIDNIYFEKLDWTSDLNTKNSLTIGNPYTLNLDYADKSKINEVKDIYRLDNTPAFRMISSNP